MRREEEEVTMLRKIVLVLVIAVVLAALYLVLWPVPVDPVAWHPPPAPELVGPYAPNNQLTPSRRLLEGHGMGPEDVAFDNAGNLYTGYDDGAIVRVSVGGGRPDVFVNTGGRPLGMTFDAEGNLIVADAFRGLLSVAPDGAVTTLATDAGGVLFGFADDLDIAPDGTIFMSDVSTKFGYGSDVLDLIEHGGHGRLVAYDPAQGTTRVVLDGLQFANGVAVARDGSFVLVAETSAYQVQRVWLDGPDAGEVDLFIDNLPGFPDNINMTDRGTVWVAQPTLRVPSLDSMGPNPFLRKVMARLPQSLQPAPIRYGLAIEVGADGFPIRSLHDPTGDVAFVTSVMERGHELYLGSHLEHSLVVVDVEIPEPESEPDTTDTEQG
jgi:sugar lactone lactonase YvrE